VSRTRLRLLPLSAVAAVVLLACLLLLGMHWSWNQSPLSRRPLPLQLGAAASPHRQCVVPPLAPRTPVWRLHEAPGLRSRWLVRFPWLQILRHSLGPTLPDCLAQVQREAPRAMLCHLLLRRLLPRCWQYHLVQVQIEVPKGMRCHSASLQLLLQCRPQYYPQKYTSELSFQVPPRQPQHLRLPQAASLQPSVPLGVLRSLLSQRPHPPR